MSNQDVLHAAALGALAFQSYRSNNPFFGAPVLPGHTGEPAHPGAAGIFAVESQKPLQVPCPFSPSFETPVQPTAPPTAIPLLQEQVPIAQYIPQEQQYHWHHTPEYVSWQPSPHSQSHFPWSTSAPPRRPPHTPWCAPQPQTHVAPPPVYQSAPPQQLFSHPVPTIQFQPSAASYVPEHRTWHKVTNPFWTGWKAAEKSSYSQQNYTKSQSQTHLVPPPVYQTAPPPQQLFLPPVPAIHFQPSASSYVPEHTTTTHNSAAAKEAPQPRPTNDGTQLRQILAMLEAINTRYGPDKSTWHKTSARITELVTIIYPLDLDTFIVCCMLNALSASHPAFVDGLLNNPDLTSRFIEERLSFKAELMAMAPARPAPSPPRRRRRRCRR